MSARFLYREDSLGREPLFYAPFSRITHLEGVFSRMEIYHD